MKAVKYIYVNFCQFTKSYLYNHIRRDKATSSELIVVINNTREPLHSFCELLLDCLLRVVSDQTFELCTRQSDYVPLHDIGTNDRDF